MEASSEDEDAALRRLREWVTASGGDVSMVRVGEVDGMRGGIVTRDVGRLQSEMMVVPTALAMSDDLDVLVTTPLGAAIGRTGLTLLQVDAHLALRLLHEVSLGAESAWRDYIALLPSRVRVARHLTDEALLASRSSFVLEQSMLARKYAASTYATLSRLVADASPSLALDSFFDEAALGWALDIVHSRSLTVDVGARGLRRFLVPVIDMLNHNPSSAQSGFTYDDDDEPPSFIVELKEGVADPVAGEQLWLDYGEQTSDELMLMYGFVPSTPTPHDRVQLEGAYSPADLEAAPGDAAMREEKEALLESCRYAPPRPFELAARRVDPAVIAALRLLSLTAEELAEECGGSWNRPLLHAPVSARNERCVAQALRARLEEALGAEGSTVKEDEAALMLTAADEALDASELDGASEAEAELEAEEAEEAEQMRMAVQLRLNRKRLLCELIDLLDGFLASFDETQVPPPNLHDAMDDYMPNIRMT